MHFLDYAVIVLYLAAVIAIGLWCSRGEKTSVNYLLGGRRMPYIAVGIACMMSLLSSVSLVMVPGEICNNGLTLFLITGPLTAILAIPCYMLFMRFYFRLGSFTPYEYLEYRYDASIRTVVAVSAFYIRTVYLALVVYTSAKIFEAAYHWPAWFSILLVGSVGIVYTLKGGAKAVIWTDVMQFFVLIGGFVVVVIIVCSKIDGGAVEAVRRAFADGHGTPQFRTAEFYSVSPYVRLLFWLLLWNAIVGPLTSACSDQITIQRLLSTRNWKEGLKSQITSTVIQLPFIALMWFSGLAIYSYYAQNPDSEIGPGKGDAALFHFVSTELPAPLPGLFMAAMLAAVMSTLSAGINSMATVWLKEIHLKFINKKLDQPGEVRISKLATVGIGMFCIICGLALYGSGKWLEQSVVEVGTIFGLLGAAILPAFLFAVLSRRANAALIWGYTAFAFGEGMAGNFWYVLSRRATQVYRNNPEAGLSWAGPLEFQYILWWLIPGILLACPYLARPLRKCWTGRISALGGLLLLGVAETLLVWYCYSQYYFTGEPLERSFAFYLPVSLFAAFALLWFLPVQPREKWQGLTLDTLNLNILVKH